MYAGKNHDKYEQIIFVNCKSIKDFQQSITTIAKELSGKEASFIESKKFLTNWLRDNNNSYLLIIDNIDLEEVLIEVDNLVGLKILQLSGSVISTGRQTPSSVKVPIYIPPLTAQEGIQLFNEALSDPQRRETFNKEGERTKRDLIEKTLQGSPLAIYFAAFLFERQASKPIEAITRVFSHSDTSKDGWYLNWIPEQSKIHYKRNLAESYLDQISDIENILLRVEKKIAASMVWDVLNFLSFSSYDGNVCLGIALSKAEMRASFLRVNQSKYQGITARNFSDAVDSVLDKLDDYSLISYDKNNEVIKTYKLVSFFVTSNYINKNKTEPMRYCWIDAVSHYYRNIQLDGVCDAKIFNHLLVALDLSQASLNYQAQLISSLSLADVAEQALISKISRIPNPLCERLQHYSVPQLEILWHSVGKVDTPEKIQMLMSLGMIYAHSDPAKAAQIFDQLLKSGVTLAHFKLGLLAQKEAVVATGEVAKHHYIQAINHYNNYSKLHPTDTLIYNHKMTCYSSLAALETNSTKKSEYLQKAREEASKVDGVEALKRFQSHVQYNTIHSSYRELICDMLKRTTGEFDFPDPSWWGHVMDEDGGVLFGQMLQQNTSIKTLRLYGTHLTDDALSAIAESLKSNDNIRVIKIEWTTRLKGKGVEKLAEMLEFKAEKNIKIEEISFQDCPKISVDSMTKLISALKLHKGATLNIKGCNKIVINPPESIKIIES